MAGPLPNELAKPATEPKPAKAEAAKSRPEAIAIRVLKFERPIDIPGKSVTEAVTATGEKNRIRWEIEYQPWIRHHKITFFPIDPNYTGDRVAMIHESKCLTWVPLVPQ